MSQSRPLLDRLRQPEYTGANRCQPCTIVNVVLAGAIAGGLALVAVELGVVAFALSLAAIYLRGYLVPYTPALTTQYLPEPVLQALGKEPAPEPADRDVTWEAVEKLEAERERGVVTDVFLQDVDAVEETDGEMVLTPAFREHVDAYLGALADESITEETIATLFDADPEDVTRKDREYPAYEVGIRIRKWPSEAALTVDLAGNAALAEWTNRWATVPVEQRAEILTLLRSARQSCPVCGGHLSETNDTVESCCVNIDRYAYRCEDCGTHLREHGDPTELSGKGLTGS